MRNLPIAITLILFATSTFSQESIHRANFMQADNWTPQKQFERTRNIWKKPVWIENTDLFAYKHVEEERCHYYLVDPGKETKRDLFDEFLLCSQLETRLDTSINLTMLDLDKIETSSDGLTVKFSYQGLNFSYNTSKNELTRLPEDESRALHQEFIKSPDGNYYLSIMDNNLVCFSSDPHTTDTVQITHDGQEYYDIVPYNIHWSPDSRYIAFIREDWRNVEDLWLIDHYARPRPTFQTYKWPMPGEQIEQYELWVYDIRDGDLIRMKSEKWPDQTLDQIRWDHNSETIFFQRMSRDWMSLDLCTATSSNGECTVLIEERGKRQIITRLPYHILDSTGEILWWSWRDGWNHYYLYDKNGKLKSQLTHGQYNTGKVIHIDEENRELYVMVNGKEPGRNPYYHHLYRISLSGNNLMLLTPENAEHEIHFSEMGNYFLDNYSRADMPPKSVVRDREGTLVIELEDADITPLEKEGWVEPEIFHVKAADDTTDIWGVLFKPYDFDSTKKYPIITYGYPGKETEFLPWRFCINAWVSVISNSLAQYGFIVVVAGNRGGSPERSYDYYNYGENDFRNYPVADKKSVVERLGKQYAFIDMERVGIMGQSSGGFMAASAILLEPEFFKVAVAKCGPQDPALYYHHWAERYMNVHVTVDSSGHTKCNKAPESNNELAENLSGKLLLVQGDMDLHVPPSLTYRLAYDLMMANKRFDMFIIPKADHFWGDNYPYVIRYMELYFVENLMGDHSFDVNMFND